MKEKSSFFHQRYVNKEEYLAFTKQSEMEVLVSKGTFHKWCLYGHFDQPLEPLDKRKKTTASDRVVLNR